MVKYDSTRDMPWTIRSANRTGNTAYVSVAHSYPIRTAQTERVAKKLALTVFDDSVKAELFNVVYESGMVYTFRVTVDTGRGIA